MNLTLIYAILEEIELGDDEVIDLTSESESDSDSDIDFIAETESDTESDSSEITLDDTLVDVRLTRNGIFIKR